MAGAQAAPSRAGPEHGRRLLPAHDRLERLPDLPHAGQLGVGALAAGAGQPGAGPRGVGQVVGGYAVDDRRAVEQGQQEVLVRHRVRHRQA